MLNTMSLGKAARLLGVSVKTLQRWEREGRLIPAANGCEILVLNQERLSPEQEMVQDLMTIVHCFSSRLYGLRNYRKKLAEALRQDAYYATDPQNRAVPDA